MQFFNDFRGTSLYAQYRIDKIRAGIQYRKARKTIDRLSEQERLRRGVKAAGFRSLQAIRELYRLDEQLNSSAMSAFDRKRRREQRASIEAELKRIAGISS